MHRCSVKLQDLGGLHLRTAAQLIQTCSAYKSKIVVCHGKACAETCSILQMLALGAGKDAIIEITADGPDEEQAIRELSGFFSEGGGI